METDVENNSQSEFLAYRQVDVFSRVPFSGNGLTVFADVGSLELRPLDARRFPAVRLAREYAFEVIPDPENPGETGAIEMATQVCVERGAMP